MRFLGLAVLLFYSLQACAQQLKVEDAVIYVSDKQNTTIYFSESIEKTTPCNDDDYQVRTESKEVRIKAKNNKPLSPCTLFITTENEFQFQFTLVYAPNKVLPFYDLTSDEKIQKFVEAGRKETGSANAKAESAETVNNASIEGNEEGDTEADNIDRMIRRSLTAERLKDYVDTLLRTFNWYREKIADRENRSASVQITKVIREIFNNCDTCRVETIGRRSGRTIRTIKAYLNGLKNMPYTEVEFSADDVMLIGNIHKDENGKYFANFSVLQNFKGYRSNELRKKAYEDFTQQIYQIEIVVTKTISEGVAKYDWQAFLTDIKAEEIKD